MTNENNSASIIGMITEPKRQFQRIKNRPTIWKPMGIIMVMYIIGTFLSVSAIDVPEELKALQIDDELSQSSSFDIIGNIVGGGLAPIISVAVVTVVYWVIAKIFQSHVTFKQMFSMNTYILFIGAIGVVINGLLTYFFGDGTSVEMTSLSYYLDVSPTMDVVISSVEVFSLWTIVLSAFGLHIVASLSKPLSWAIPIIFVAANIFLSIMILQAAQNLFM
ncbi:MAG TPA: Yip1 family protein [Bacillota bacterium]|nr:Yip1 family protein [Bacillota bacterium]